MRTNLFLGLALCLLLSGCVTLQINQKLHRDGNVDMSVTFVASKEILTGFENITVNSAIRDRYTYTVNDGNLTYAFTDIPPGTFLFELEKGKPASFFGIESYTVEKEFHFPYYRYTYTLKPASAFAGENNTQARAMLKVITMEYTVETFGTVTATSGTKIDDSTVQFTLDPTSDLAYTIEFKDFFLWNWLG